MKKSLIADFLLLIVTLLWGTGFVFTKMVVDSGVEPLLFIAYRALIGSLFLIPFILFKREKIDKEMIIHGCILGLILTLAFAFQTYGIKYTTPSKNAFLTTLNVIFVPFLLLIVFKNKLKIISVVAAIVAFTGASIMTFESNMTIGLGDLLSIICAFMWALHIIFIGRFTKKHNPFYLTLIQLIVTGVFCLILSLLFETTPSSISLSTLSSILYLSLFCTVIGFGLQIWAQKYTTSVKASIIFTFEGVFGAFFSFLIYNEIIDGKVIVGGIIIFLAVLLSEVGPNLLNKRRKTFN